MSRTSFDRSGSPSRAPRAKGRVTLNRSDVVRAGVEILDREGVEGLSMRRLATFLETGPATLYWHVRDKDELLRLVLDEIFGRVRVPDVPRVREWEPELVALLTDVRAVLLPRPALVHVVWRSGWDLGPHVLRVADHCIRLIAASGLPDDQVADAHFALVTFVLGHVVAETAAAGTAPFPPGGDPPERTGDDRGDGPDEDHAGLRRYGPSTEAHDMDRRFSFALTRLVRALAPQ